MIREFLASGKVGNIELDKERRLREEVAKRWDALGFTEGLEGHKKETIATLFENTAKQIMKETTDASNSGSFETVVFPMIRRVFSKLLANDIVSVQAMNMSIGKVFFLRPVTSERLWEGDGQGILSGLTGSHQGMMGANLRDRNANGADLIRGYVPGVTLDASGVTTNYAKSLYDLFYDDFLYDNSKGKVHLQMGSSVPVSYVDGNYVTGATSATNVLAVDGTLRHVILAVSGFNTYGSGKLTGADGNEMDTETFMASLKVIMGDAKTLTGTTSFAAGEAVPFRVMTQKYGKGIVERDNVCDATGTIYLEVDLTKPSANNLVDGYQGVDSGNTVDATTFKIGWATYDTLELDTEIGEVGVTLDSLTISVEERKLRATWSPEMAQDVAVFQNIDAEAELTAVLSQQVGAEIDREILRELRVVAPWKLKFDVNGWRKITGYSTNYTQKDWNQELFTKINQISGQIQKSTLQGGANFIVISTEISALFNNLEYFHVSDASAESDQYNLGIERIGSLQNRYQVYVDPYSPYASIIVGHHGKSLMDTGYIYAPYIPLTLSPLMYNPFNGGAPIKYIMSRYAKKVVNNKFYGQVHVDGLQTWSTNEFR